MNEMNEMPRFNQKETNNEKPMARRRRIRRCQGESRGMCENRGMGGRGRQNRFRND